MDDLESTVAALRSEFQKTLNDKTENQKSLEENLAAAKHDLLRVQEQLSMAEKVGGAAGRAWPVHVCYLMRTGARRRWA